jgi:hypothetical protein
MSKYEIAGRLQYLANKHGDFKVAKSWRKKDGEIIWSRHKSVLECSESIRGIEWLNQVSHRQILPIEIVLDLDENPTIQKLNIICDELEKKEYHYKAYETGSRGFHIHIFLPNSFILLNKRLKEQVREDMIKEFGADLHKKNEVLIALEEAPHWKTGNIKKKIRGYPNE